MPDILLEGLSSSAAVKGGLDTRKGSSVDLASASPQLLLLCVLVGAGAAACREAGMEAEDEADTKAGAAKGVEAGGQETAGTHLATSLLFWPSLALFSGICIQAESRACMADVLPVSALLSLLPLSETLGLLMGTGAYVTLALGVPCALADLLLLAGWARSTARRDDPTLLLSAI